MPMPKPRPVLARLTVLLAGLLIFGCSADGTHRAPGGSVASQQPPSGSNGQIVFERGDPKLGDTTTYTMNPDGSHVQQLFARGSEFPHWSPDGGKVSVFCCDDGMAAHIVDPDTADFRELAPPDPALEVHCGLWSPDGQRVACESYGTSDPKRNGIYSIRTSDGSGLKRITTDPGGADTPGDYSPDGKHLVFVRQTPTHRVGLFVTKLDGRGLREIPTPGLLLDFGFHAGTWSPKGNKLLFAARKGTSNFHAIWIVNPDGSGLHQLPLQPSCGGAASDPNSTACLDPSWSPDGTKLVFIRANQGRTQGDIYTVSVDGSDLVQLTTTGDASLPDWGPHPLAQ
jgi:Tol biopolymer transport system component